VNTHAYDPKLRGSAFNMFRLGLLLATGLTALSALASAADLPVAAPKFAHMIYLVRHGAYDANAKVDPEVGGSLTPLGIAEARLIGSRLRGLPVHFDSITSSTMQRARETAVIVRESLPEVELRQSADLSECTPLTSRPLEGKSPDEQAACTRRLDHVFDERFKPATTANRNDLIVAHGNVIRYLVMKALGVDTHAWLGLSIAHASLTVIRVRADGTKSVLSVGDVGHIPPDLQSWGADSDPQLTIPR
jgi:serine/threonine-protein phosphatase PGAM5